MHIQFIFSFLFFNFKLARTKRSEARTTSSPGKAVYNPKTFFPHAASLHQAFAHCGRFSTAASRRSMARISMPSLGNALSRPLPVIALVSHYLTNKLIGRKPIPEPKRNARFYSFLPAKKRDYRELVRLSANYARLWGWLFAYY